MATLRVPGGMRRRLAEITEIGERVTPHQARPLPTPGPDHYAHLAERKRREAESILRHLRAGEPETLHTRWARQQARVLHAEAAQYEAMAREGWR